MNNRLDMQWSRRDCLKTGALGLLATLASGRCSRSGETPEATTQTASPVAPADRPNVLWIVWDTVRADHLGTYGHNRPTSPKLDAWAKQARVFEDCQATAPHTIPSTASMFTGLLPTEHGCSNASKPMRASYPTIPEVFRGNGYRTYMYSANPHVSDAENYHRGFDRHEYPWQPKYNKKALEIVKKKILPQDKSSELVDKVREQMVGPWNIKACGELAQQGTLEWLHASDTQKPYFVFLNYMEAHRPYIPPDSYRRRMMNEQQVARSYAVDRSWTTIWSYTFRLHEFTDEELDIIGRTYDASLAELDDLLANLLAALQADGQLENTVIVLTSDHGENLGEHHMLDHQFALYQSLLHVPLILHYPKKITAGREARPVSTIDIIPTLLELAGIPMPGNMKTSAVSLLSPREDRKRIAEYTAPFDEAINNVKRARPDWKPDPVWYRTLRSLTIGGHKFILGSDGQKELYQWRQDPAEKNNLVNADPKTSEQMAAELNRIVSTLSAPDTSTAPHASQSDEQLERLKAMGYILDEGASRPAPGPQ